jgi:manganese/zinc/iron transport system permease protein
MNPYSGVGFFEFFGLLLQRLFSGSSLVSDEIQLAVLCCSAVACGLVGPFVVLKKMSLFANALSHTTLLGVACAFLLAGTTGMLLLGALISALLTAAITELLGRVFRLSADASIGLVFSALFALGIVVVTVWLRNAHLGVEAVMGHADALQRSDLTLALSLLGFNGVFVLVFHRQLTLVAFDENLSRTLGFSAVVWRVALFFLTALTCITAFRSVGVLVVLALLIGPYLTARLFCQRLGQLLLWTPVLGITACLIAVAASRSLLSTTGVPLSTAGILSVVIGLQFAVAATVKSLSTRRKIC